MSVDSFFAPANNGVKISMATQWQPSHLHL